MVTGLISGGVGATIGSVATSIIQVWSKRGESRGHAADLVTAAAERVLTRLEGENKQMRQAILLLTDVLDEVLPELHAAPGTLDKLKRAKAAAQLAV